MKTVKWIGIAIMIKWIVTLVLVSHVLSVNPVKQQDVETSLLAAADNTAVHKFYHTDFIPSSNYRLPPSLGQKAFFQPDLGINYHQKNEHLPDKDYKEPYAILPKNSLSLRSGKVNYSVNDKQPTDNENREG